MEQENFRPFAGPQRKTCGFTKPYISIQGFENRYKPFKTKAMGRGFNHQQEKA